MSAAVMVARKRAVLLELQALASQSRADLGTLAGLIATARRPAPLNMRRSDGAYLWRDAIRASFLAANAAERLDGFAELAGVVFAEAQAQGPQSLAAACLRLLAAVVPDLEAQRGGMVGAVVHAVSCEAAGWHPSMPREPAQVQAQSTLQRWLS